MPDSVATANQVTGTEAKKREVQPGEVKFNFRKTKDPETGEEQAAPEPIYLKYKSLTMPDVAAMLNGEGLTPEETGKVHELVLSSLNDVQLEYIKTLFDDLGYDEVRAKGIDPELYSFKIIAMLPPTSRGASGIAEELWEEFVQDYQDVIVHNGVDPKRAKVGADILKNKLNKVKLNKDALLQFKSRIQTWYGNSSKAEQLTPVYEYLIRRAEKLIQANEPQNVLASF